jgi:hypothetical protein
LLGWFRDLWRLPSYVAHANADEEYVAQLRLQHRLSPKQPPLSWTLASLVAQLFFGAVFGAVAATAFDLLQVWPVPPFPTWSSAGGSPAAFLSALASWPYVLRVVSVLMRLLGLSVGVKMAGDAHRLQSASFLPIVLSAVLAHLPLAMAGAFSPSMHSSSAPAEGSDTGDDALLQESVGSEHSFLVIGAAMLAYHLGRGWSREAIGLMGIRHDSGSSSSSTNGINAGAPGGLAVEHSLVAPKAPRRRQGLCVRFLRFSCFCWIFCALSVSFVLHLSPSSSDDPAAAAAGVPLKVSLVRLYRHPDVQQALSQLRAEWLRATHPGRARGAEEGGSSGFSGGFGSFWSRMHAANQRAVVEEAAETLGLNVAQDLPTLTTSQLRKKRNQLALHYHPDKTHPTTQHLSTLEKQTKFTHIQKAYQVLQKYIAQRDKRPQSASPHAPQQASPRKHSPPSNRAQRGQR